MVFAARTGWPIQAPAKVSLRNLVWSTYFGTSSASASTVALTGMSSACALGGVGAAAAIAIIARGKIGIGCGTAMLTR